MIPEQYKSLTTASFDQGGHQKPIDSPLRLLPVHQILEFPSVSAWLESPKLYLTALQKISHPLEVFQFFANDFHHFLTQIFVLNVIEHQIHGCRSSLLFTMGVINQNLVQIPSNLSQPAVRGIGLQVQHLQHDTFRQSTVPGFHDTARREVLTGSSAVESAVADDCRYGRAMAGEARGEPRHRENGRLPDLSAWKAPGPPGLTDWCQFPKSVTPTGRKFRT